MGLGDGFLCILSTFMCVYISHNKKLKIKEWNYSLSFRSELVVTS